MTKNSSTFWDQISVNLSYVLEFVPNNEVYNREDFLNCYCDIYSIDSLQVKFIERLIKIGFIDFFYMNLNNKIKTDDLNQLIEKYNREFVEESSITLSDLMKICRVYNINIEVALIKKKNDICIEEVDNHINDPRHQKNNIIVSILSSLFFIIITLVLVPISRNYMVGLYNYSIENYETAIISFEENSDFLNSKELITKSHYRIFEKFFPNTQSSMLSLKFLKSNDYSNIDTLVIEKVKSIIEINADKFNNSSTTINDICISTNDNNLCTTLMLSNIENMIHYKQYNEILFYMESENIESSEMKDKVNYLLGIELFNESQYEEALDKFIKNPDYLDSTYYINDINQKLEWHVQNSRVENDQKESNNFKPEENVSYRGLLAGGIESEKISIKVIFFDYNNKIIAEHIYEDYMKDMEVMFGFRFVDPYVNWINDYTFKEEFGFKVLILKKDKWIEIDRISFYYGN